jgi:flagellar biosynthesis protein FlhA
LTLPPQDNAATSFGADLLLPIGVVAVLIMIIIPIPTFLMNLLIVLNISIGVVVILTVVYMDNVTNFSVFPSLLLIQTVFGLAVNVTTTRNILLGGPQRVEGVITAFGRFVMGENVIVGIIIFSIIMVIQFLVIVKGTTRVSEVAARFTLDAMPGKQMAIDADLNSGLIDQQEAKARRKEIRQEADFYGAMDGASKFVKGNVVAGIIILLINSLGGWAIGVFQMGMEPVGAIQTYVILTAGDGLAAQIPALMIATATGMIVTQSSDTGDMGENLAAQLTRYPKALYLTGGTIITLGTITPLPFISMSIIGGGLIALGYSVSEMRRAAVEEEQRREEAEEEEEEARPEDVKANLRFDPMELEVGYALVPLVDPDQGGDLLERITVIRGRTALDMGLIVPPIRIRDNLGLDPNTYVIKLRNAEVAEGQAFPDQFMAMNPGEVSEELQGEETIEPAFGCPAIWIGEDERERAEQAGYIVADASSVVATHLTKVIKDNAAEILGRDQVHSMVEQLEQDYPALVNEVVPDPVSYSLLQKVLERLLGEKISVRNLVTIVETLDEKMSENVTDVTLLAEYCRMALSREITREYMDEDDNLKVISFDPGFEQQLQQRLGEGGQGLPFSPQEGQQFMQQLQSEWDRQEEQGNAPVILVSAALRRPVYEFVNRQIKDVVVMSYEEVSNDADIQVVGQLGASAAPAEQ